VCESEAEQRVGFGSARESCDDRHNASDSATGKRPWRRRRWIGDPFRGR
jgi:hypothetical protein